MDDGIELVCPTEESGEAGGRRMGDAGSVARFAFKGRDPEDEYTRDAAFFMVFRAAVDREPEDNFDAGDTAMTAFRLRLGREAESVREVGDEDFMALRFAIGR